MLQLIYVSSATRAMGMDDLAALLRTSRRNNGRLEITGLLLYREGAFLQVLEGHAQDVDLIYERIRADDRHTDVTTLLRAPVEKRDFPGWAMGFRGLGALARADVPGFSPFVDKKTILKRLADKPGPASETVQRFLEIEV